MSISQNLFGRISLHSKKKDALFLLILFTFVVIVFAVNCIFGSTSINIKEGFNSFKNGEYHNSDFLILKYLRLPRALAALFSGCALAVSGVIIQALLSNPMAAPNIIGVNSGAGLSATVIIALFPTTIYFLPLAAFFGALTTCLFIYFISIKSSATKLTITLVGIAVGNVLNAIINTIKVFVPDSVYDTDIFMIGGFSGVTFSKIVPAIIIIIISLIFALFFAKDIDILSLGDLQAKSLGLNVKFKRLILMVIASALAGAAVSFAGLLGFVGLLVPHIVRKFTGNRHIILIPASAMSGSILVLICDLISRVVIAPFEIPVGILLSFIGGIFFICIVLFGKSGKEI